MNRLILHAMLTTSLTVMSYPAIAQEEDEKALEELDRTRAVQTAPAVEIQGSAELRGAMLRIARRPTDSDALIDAGNAALMLGDANAALNFFSRADALQPASGRIKQGLAIATVRTENPFEALRLFDEAIRLGVPERALAADRALAFDLLGNFARAQQEYEIAKLSDRSSKLLVQQAISMALGGKEAEADAILYPLLTQNYGEAWRARAFLLAARGDFREAVKVTQGFMDPRSAQQFERYLRQLPQLTGAQKAAAIHLGHFPANNIGRDSEAIQRVAANYPASGGTSDGRLVPSGEPLGPKSGSARSKSESKLSRREQERAAKRVAQAVTVPTAIARPVAEVPGLATRIPLPIDIARTRIIEAEKASFGLVAVAPAWPVTAQAAPLIKPVSLSQSPSLTQPPATTSPFPSTPASTTPAWTAPALKPAASAPASITQATAVPTIAVPTIATPATTIPTTTIPPNLAQPAPAQPVSPQRVLPSPVNVAATAPVAEVPKFVAVAAAQTSPVIVQPLPVPAIVSPQQQQPVAPALTAPITNAPQPSVSQAPSAQPAPVAVTPPAFSTVTLPQPVSPITQPITQEPVQVPTSAPAQISPSAPTASTLDSVPAISNLSDAPVVGSTTDNAAPTQPVTAATVPADPGFDLGAIVGAIDIPEAEKTSTVAAVDLKRIAAAAKAKAAEAKAAETEITKKAEDKKAKTAAKTAAPESPARIWVQIATGAETGFSGDIRNFRRKYPELAKGRESWSSPWGKSSRLLIGPFAEIKDAKKWEADFRKAGGNGFVWRSEKGTEVKPLKSK